MIHAPDPAAGGTDGYPTPDDFRCEWEDHHADMYPEFAPDPIVVRCPAPATVLLAGWEPADHPAAFGLPVARRYCRQHADREMAGDEFGYDDPMHGRWTRIAMPNEDLETRVERIRHALEETLVTRQPAPLVRERLRIELELLVAELTRRFIVIVARDRNETDPCQRGTVGCCVDHIGDTECTTW